MRDQEQFLHVLDRDEAERRFRAALDLTPRGIDTVPLDAALGRVLAADVISPVDVPSFDRSNVDGFAVVAEDTFGASEEVPRTVALAEETIHTGIVPTTVIRPGTAVEIATGGMVPRGADAVVMVEHAEISGRELRIARATTPGSGVSFAGTDITSGETVLRRGQLLTSRDTGVLAAIGVATVDVWRKPVVAILSTGDEIIAPGEPMQPAKVYDSNAQVLADAVRELGGEPKRLGITHDDLTALREKLQSTRSRPATSCCSPVARAKARAIFPIASSPNFEIPGLSRTASRSSPASPFAWRRRAAVRSSCSPAFPRRRSSRFTSSSRRY